MPTQNQNDARARAAIANMAMRLKQHEAQLSQLTALQKAVADAPKWIEQIPGRRVPFNAVIDLRIERDSTSKVDGTYHVSEDGPFVVTAIALFYKRLEDTEEGAQLSGVWGYATATDARVRTNYPTVVGYAEMDIPHVTSGSLQIADRGSDRVWQNKELSSALFSPSAGGVYVLPIACLFERNSVIEASFSPSRAVSYLGLVQTILLGYKIVQGLSYQP